MDREHTTAPRQVSLLRLVGMFFSPLALRPLLEPPPRSGDRREAVAVRYRNSRLLHRHLDAQIHRSAAVVLGCFFLQPVFSLLLPSALLYLALMVLMLAATLHAVVLGFYRQVLARRIDRCAGILGLERPDDREEPQEFPRDDAGGSGPGLKPTRKLPLRRRRGRPGR
jgi:hypothetical protein